MSTIVAILSLVALSTNDSYAGDPLSKEGLSNETPWRIWAKSLSYNEKDGTYLAEGDVAITKAQQTLYTQKAVFNKKTGVAKVSGGLRLETDGDIITGQKGWFNLETQTGEIMDGSLFLRSNHYYVSGSLMQKVGKDTYVIKDCSVTTCDGVNPDWTITGSEVKVTIEGYGTVKHSAFRIRGLPILYIPYMFFPAKTKRQTGLLPPSAGYSTLNGGQFEVPFFWAISEQTDATFYQRYMSKRGYMQGVEFRYLVDESSKGILEFNILSDKIKEKNMNDRDSFEVSPYDRTNRTRYWVRSRSDQELPLGVVARLDTDYVSDQDYLREFKKSLFGFSTRTDLAGESRRPFAEKRSPTRRSALRLSHDAESMSLQGVASYYQQVEDPSEKRYAKQPLGSLDFILLPEQFKGLPVFFDIESSYDYIWSDEAERGHNISVSPQLNFPLWLGPYVEFEPSFKYIYDALWVESGNEQKDHQYQAVYDANVRLATNVERVYDLEWFNAKKVRHKISPTLNYTYRGFRTNGDEDNPPWSTSVFEDYKKEQINNRISFSLNNFLDARLEDKKGRVTYHQWATFKLVQGYDLDKAGGDKDDRPLTPLRAELTASPFPAFDLKGSTGWNHYDHGFTETTLSGELYVNRSGGRIDSYEVDYQYVKDGQKNLSFRFDVNLSYGFSAGASLQRDFDVDYNISSAGWLGYQSQCWGLKLGAERESGDTTVIAVIRLVGLGDAGNW